MGILHMEQRMDENFVHADVGIKKDKNKIVFLIRTRTKLFRWEMDQELEIGVRGLV